MNDFKDFWTKNKGIIIGVAIAVVLLVTGLHNLIIALILIFGCAFIGNYVYKNKNDVKEKLRNFIDKI